jgi:thiol-disulfide isomerase/thioredoxin
MRTSLTRTIPAAAIVVGAGLAGFFAYGHLVRPGAVMATASPPARQAPEAGPVSRGVARAVPPTVGTDGPSRKTIPETLPDIAFADRLGAERRFSDWKGHPLLVNFWAAWCEPCREEIPLLERLSRQRAPQGLRVIGVAVDSRAAVLDYARHAGIQYPLLIGEQPGLDTVRALGMQAVFPFSVFVDARGRIVTLKIGKLRQDEASLILDRIDDLDQGRMDLGTARRAISLGMAKLAVARAQATSSGPL